ncbi:MAG: family 10 glycosylhydrolase [Candidatus Limnocylindrus sp.]
MLGCSATRPSSHLVARLQRWHSNEEVAYFMEGAKLAGITTVHVIAKHDEDDVLPSGTAFYSSKIAPVWSGAASWDPLEAAVTEGHRRGLKVYAWVPQFHDKVAATKHPEWEMQVAISGVAVPFSEQSSSVFVNPIDPRVRAYEQSIIEEIVRNYSVDGIDLDWVRFDNTNMDVGPVSRTLAMAEAGIDPLALNFMLPPDDPRLSAWQAWRTSKIAMHVHSIRDAIDLIRPGVHLAAFILPQSFSEVGQDLAQFADVLDEVEPMCYFHDWGFDPLWVVDGCMRDVVAKIELAHATTRIVPTLGTNEAEDDIATVLNTLNANYPSLDAIAWFTHGGWSNEAMSEAAARLESWR